MVFGNPVAFFFLVSIPILLILIWHSNRLSDSYKRIFAEEPLYNLLVPDLSRNRRIVKKFLYLTGLLFLILSMTEPQFGLKTEIIKGRGIDIVIALDTSYSMLSEDVAPNRFKQASLEISRLIDKLDGDRVALITFSGASIVQCPLTTDYSAAKTFLDFQYPGIIPETGTNIEKAINNSLSVLKQSETNGNGKVIILFTDGESLSGNSIEASKTAASRGIRIFTVGIGTTSGSLIPIRGKDGNISDYKKDSRGNVVKSTLDDDTLKKIADITSGTYISSSGSGANIQVIIDMLGKFDTEDIHERKISRLKHRYNIPLGLSLIFLIAWMFVGERHSGKKIREG